MNLLLGNIGALHIQQLLDIFEGLRVRVLFSQGIINNLPPGIVHIENKSRIILTEYGDNEINLSPLEKALYFLYLHHPEGIYLRFLVDYKEPLAVTR